MNVTTETINELMGHAAAGRLGRSKEFAEDLAATFLRGLHKGRGLSESQAAWVHKLIARAKGEDDPTPKAPEALDENVQGVFALLHKAKSNGLKFPKIRLQVGEGATLQGVVLSLAGEKSRTPGHVHITDGGHYGENRYFGRIDPEGQLHAGRDINREVRLIIAALATDPVRVARGYGHLTGHCCFCHLPLNDDRSTAAGYGPVCAKRFGLEWGEEVA